MRGGGCPTFLFFKSLDNNVVYTLGIYIYIYIYLLTLSHNCGKKSYGFKNRFLLLLQQPIGSRQQSAHKPIQQESSVLINQ